VFGAYVSLADWSNLKGTKRSWPTSKTARRRTTRRVAMTMFAARQAAKIKNGHVKARNGATTTDVARTWSAGSRRSAE
jgi:hypothetical protein